MINDGALAGQWVSCSNCRGQFQMPPTAPPIAMPRPVVVDGAMPVIDVSRTPRRDAVRRAPGMWDVSLSRVAAAVFTMLIICGLGVLLVVFVAVMQDAQTAKDTGSPTVVVGEPRVDASWQSRGYKDGYAFGLRLRNNDKRLDTESAMYIQIHKKDGDFRVIGTRMEYDIDPQYPQRGTNDYGDYKIGFERGFQAGLYGTSGRF